MKDRLVLTLSILLILTTPGLFARGAAEKAEQILLLPAPVCQRDPDPAGEEPEYSGPIARAGDLTGEKGE